MAKKYYAIKKGKETGIFDTWKECYDRTHGHSGAVYRAFETYQEAKDYLNSDENKVSARHETEEEVYNSISDGEIAAYVDGSNLGDGTEFSWGVIIFCKEKGKIEISDKSSDEKFAKFRNVAGELFASVKAIDYAIKNKKKKVYIYHDYSGIRHFALGEWKTKNILSKVYREFYEKSMKVIDIEFMKTDGHTGDRFNEEADVLAKKALNIL